MENFFLIGVWLNIYIFVCGFLCVCGSLELTLDFFRSSFHFFCLRQDFSLNVELTHCPEWLANILQGSHCPHSSCSNEVQARSLHSWSGSNSGPHVCIANALLPESFHSSDFKFKFHQLKVIFCFHLGRFCSYTILIFKNFKNSTCLIDTNTSANSVL